MCLFTALYVSCAWRAAGWYMFVLPLFLLCYCLIYVHYNV